MKPKQDPEQAEIKQLKAACDLSGKTVLEIGCGDGRIMRQYARMTHKVIGIDPAGSELRNARNKAPTPKSLFLQGMGEYLPFSAGEFDTVIFASSL